MLAADIRAIDALSRRHWTYRVNDVMKWRSYADDALKGLAWAGDCTDLASTVLDIMGRRGAPLDTRYRLLVSTLDTDVPDHMVAATADDAGLWWIAGDSFEGVTGIYPAVRLPYRPCEYNRLDEIDTNYQPTWRAGLPWTAKS